MRARNRPEDGDEHDQDRAGRNGVAEQRDRLVSAGEALGHDAGADDGGDENGGAERLRQQAAGRAGTALAHSAGGRRRRAGVPGLADRIEMLLQREPVERAASAG